MNIIIIEGENEGNFWNKSEPHFDLLYFEEKNEGSHWRWSYEITPPDIQ